MSYLRDAMLTQRRDPVSVRLCLSDTVPQATATKRIELIFGTESTVPSAYRRLQCVGGQFEKCKNKVDTVWNLVVNF